jgi:DNA-binding GntR family transcriptional regulator
MIGDIYEVRSTLETSALRRPQNAQTTHDMDALKALRVEWQELADSAAHEPDPAFVTNDESFHISLAEAAGNYVLADQLRLLNDRIRIVRMQDFLVEGRIEATITEHLGILDSVLSGDMDRADTLLADHIELSESVVADRVRDAVARMVSGGEA